MGKTMKYYGIRQKKSYEALAYRFAKWKYFCLQYTTFSKKKRNRSKMNYEINFRNPYRFRDKSSAIPNDKYCSPICAITYDTVLRENIPQLKSGLKKLLKRNLSHKFVGGGQSLDKIFACIETMDDTLTTWHDWINVGIFDFEEDNLLKNFISYFDIYIRNINSSHLAIETHLHFSDSFLEKQIEIINNDYKDKAGHVYPALMRNQKVSGGKQSQVICHYSDSALKSDLIYENFSVLKWRFYDRMQKFFPTVLHSRGVPPPTVYIYKTNISYTETDTEEFWASVGIMGYAGQFIDNSRKLFFNIHQSGRYDLHRMPARDLIYLVNDTTMEREKGYYSPDIQIEHEFAMGLSDPICKLQLLEVMNDTVASQLIDYKHKLHKIKLKKNKLHKLLKLRYLYERDIDFYRRYIHDNIWERPQEKISRIFCNHKGFCAYGYKSLTEAPIVAKEKIVEQLGIIGEEFDSKTSVLQHLSAYKSEAKNRKINLTMLFFTATTLLFVIFPKWSENLAEFLNYIWFLLKNFAKILV